MLEEYNKKIETIRETLDTLPKTNKKNIQKYKDEVNNYINSFNEDKRIVEEEIKRRRDNLTSKIRENDTTNIDNNINNIINGIYLTDEYNTSYEKLGMDKIIYNISKYYKNNLEIVNDNIVKAIKLFKAAKIDIKLEDFCYSPYALQYIDVIIKNINNVNTELVRNSFQDIYWKCSDVLLHISLNFRYLYYKNKKYFDIYCNNLLMRYLGNKKKEEIIDYYKKLVIKRDNLRDSDIVRIVNKFKNKELTINDFEEEKINNNYNELINNIPYSEEIINDIINYKDSILEYQDYLSIKYIIDDISDIYKKEHTGYKSNIKNQFKEIKKIESKLFSTTKKINKINSGKKGLFNKKVDTSKMIIDINNYIKEINEKYILLDNSLFKERVNTLLNDNSSYYDVLNLGYDNYTYLVSLIKKDNSEISLEEIDKEIERIKKIIYNPYITLINNVNIVNEKDLKIIVYDKYKLANFNTREELFDSESDMGHALELIEKIMTNYYISKSSINVLDIKYLCNIEEYNL